MHIKSYEVYKVIKVYNDTESCEIGRSVKQFLSLSLSHLVALLIMTICCMRSKSNSQFRRLIGSSESLQQSNAVGYNMKNSEKERS